MISNVENIRSKEATKNLPRTGYRNVRHQARWYTTVYDIVTVASRNWVILSQLHCGWYLLYMGPYPIVGSVTIMCQTIILITTVTELIRRQYPEKFVFQICSAGNRTQHIILRRHCKFLGHRGCRVTTDFDDDDVTLSLLVATYLNTPQEFRATIYSLNRAAYLFSQD